MSVGPAAEQGLLRLLESCAAGTDVNSFKQVVADLRYSPLLIKPSMVTCVALCVPCCRYASSFLQERARLGLEEVHGAQQGFRWLHSRRYTCDQSTSAGHTVSHSKFRSGPGLNNSNRDRCCNHQLQYSMQHSGDVTVLQQLKFEQTTKHNGAATVAPDTKQLITATRSHAFPVT